MKIRGMHYPCYRGDGVRKRVGLGKRFGWRLFVNSLIEYLEKLGPDLLQSIAFFPHLAAEL